MDEILKKHIDVYIKLCDEFGYNYDEHFTLFLLILSSSKEFRKDYFEYLKKNMKID